MAIKCGLTQIIEGLPAPVFFSADAWKRALAYKPRDDDVILSTFPKCGTTWTQHILTLIYLNGRPFKDSDEFYRRSPFLEMAGPEVVEQMERPGIIKTHFPYEMTPYNPKTKYVYVVRNPKDTCVSLFHHERNFPGYEFQDGKFDDFFEEFCQGRVEWGSYFEHLNDWYKHKDDPNVLFITYESIKKDHPGAVMKCARFLGSEYSERLEKDSRIVDRIVEYSSVDYMKAHTDASFTDMFGMSSEDIDKSPNFSAGLKMALKGLCIRPSENKKREFNFVRKGIVGDWRNIMSKEQSRKMDDLLREECKWIIADDIFEGAMREVD